MTTTEVENFPGFSEGITGPNLMQQMRQQALRWGAKSIVDDVVRVDFQQRPFTIVSEEEVIQTHAVIICTGATAKWLHLPGEEKLLKGEEVVEKIAGLKPKKVYTQALQKAF